MELKIEEGAHYDPIKCPLCGETEQIQSIDGDTVCTPLDSYRSFDARLLLFRCNACHKDFYIIDVSMVDNPAVSESWINKYFWHNETVEEPSQPMTTYYEGKSKRLPSVWLELHTNTPEGKLTRFLLGPFVPESQLSGLYGVACCMGQPEWQNAAFLVADVLMLRITGEDPGFDLDEIPF